MGRKRIEQGRYVKFDQVKVVYVDGKPWSPIDLAYVCRCWNCRQYFLSKRPHSVSCTPACRKERSRRLGGFGEFRRGFVL